jgi:hypothetical protein
MSFAQNAEPGSAGSNCPHDAVTGVNIAARPAGTCSKSSMATVLLRTDSPFSPVSKACEMQKALPYSALPRLKRFAVETRGYAATGSRRRVR